MTPKRLSAKFFTTDPTAALDLHDFIGTFHKFIQEQSVEGLLIDVADYSHVPDGPGVVLIGHDVDYSMDLSGGRAGLLTLTKRIEDGDLSDQLDRTVRWGLLAMKAIESAGASGVEFATDRVQVRIVDRLAGPNSEEGFSQYKAEFEALASRLFGDHVGEVSRADLDEPRRMLAVDLVASKSEALDTLIANLGG
jgi:hypothetical protein